MCSELLAVLALAAAPATGGSGASCAPAKTAEPTPRTGVELRDAVQEALPRWARPSDEEADQAAREFLALYSELQQDDQLAQSQREYLKAKVRIRLERLAEQISKRIVRQKRSAQGVRHPPDQQRPTGVNPPLRKVDPLAQQLGMGNVAAGVRDVGFGQPGGGADDNGQQLVDLIQHVIAPTTWDVNGGPGSIYYWRNGKALVIRQMDEVHEQIANLLEQLRRLGP